MPAAKSCFFSKAGVLGRAGAERGSFTRDHWQHFCGCWLGEGTGTSALPGSLLQRSATRCPCKPRSLLGSAGETKLSQNPRKDGAWSLPGFVTASVTSVTGTAVLEQGIRDGPGW